MMEPITVLAPDDALEAFVRDLLARADDAWTRRAGPAAMLQALHARLDAADTGTARRAFCLALIEGDGRPQAQAMVSGGIRARFEARIGADEALCAAFARTYARWPQSARILHLIRLFRAPPGAGDLPPDMDGPVRALMADCAAPGTFGDAPFEMCHGFLHAAAGSDRLPQVLRAEALAAADGLLLRTRDEVPPSVLLRSIARAAAATRRAGATPWARACIEASGIAGVLSEPALVHVATLAVFRETSAGLGGALALLKDAATARTGGTASDAFTLAPALDHDGLFCRGLLVRPSGRRTREKPAQPTLSEKDAAPARTRGSRRKATGPVAPETEPPRAAKPTLRERHGPPPGDTDASMRAATRRAATRLLNRLRAKNARKETPPG